VRHFDTPPNDVDGALTSCGMVQIISYLQLSPFCYILCSVLTGYFPTGES